MASDSGTARAELIAAVRARRTEFAAAGDRAEAERNLPADTMETLRELGAFWLKTPAELGGTPLDPLDFCDVLEEFALTDTATAWAVMVGNGGTGTAGGWLPEAGARRVFDPGRRRPLVVGTPGPRGTGHPVAGGYLVSGQWSFASGCGHADWLIGGFRLAAAPIGRADGRDRAARAGDDHRQLAGRRAARQRQLRLPARRGVRSRGADVRAGRERLPRRRAVQRGSARVPVQRTAAADDRHGPPRARRDGRPRWPDGAGFPAAPPWRTARCSAPNSAGRRPGCGRPGRRTGKRSRRPGRPPWPARCRRTCTPT